MVEAAYNKRMLSDRFPLRFNSAANAGVGCPRLQVLTGNF